MLPILAPILAGLEPAPLISAPAAAAPMHQPASRPAPSTPVRVPVMPGLFTGNLSLIGGGGNRPDIWGMSRACARMVRKNRIRASRAKR
jgi:hypothetical protein